MKTLLTSLMLAVPALSIASPMRQFHIEYSVPAVRGGAQGLLFVSIPSDDRWQTVTNVSIQGSRSEYLHDPRFGNAAARMEVSSGASVRVNYDIARTERGADLRGATGQPASDVYSNWLADDARVKVDVQIPRYSPGYDKRLLVKSCSF